MRKTFLLLILGMMLLATMVIATPTATVSSANDYLKGTTNSITCTVSPTDNFGSLTNISTASFFYRNTTAGDWQEFGQNTTFNLTVYTMNLNSALRLDSSTFGLNCTIYVNGSLASAQGGNISSAVITKTSDNTAPSVTVDLAYSIANKFQTVDCKTLSSDATAGMANYSTNLTKPDSTVESSSPSNGVQDYLQDVLVQPSDNGYTATCLVTDSAGNKGQASTTFGVTSLDGQSKKAVQVGLVQTTAIKTKSVVMIIGVLFVLGVAIVLLTKKSKKRRR